jgi:hypothetical protein
MEGAQPDAAPHHLELQLASVIRERAMSLNEAVRKAVHQGLIVDLNVYIGNTKAVGKDRIGTPTLEAIIKKVL